jgi:pilus assembly protein CpaC
VPGVREVVVVLVMAGCSSFLTYRPVQATARAASSAAQTQSQNENHSAEPVRLKVKVGKSLLIDSKLEVTRFALGDEKLAEAVAVSPWEVLINGKAQGETSLIVWQKNGARLDYNLTVAAAGGEDK